MSDLPKSQSTLGGEEAGDERYSLLPIAVAVKALQSEKYAEAVLEELGKFARLGIEPGEVGVIVFPTSGAPYFEVAEDPAVTRDYPPNDEAVRLPKGDVR